MMFDRTLAQRLRYRPWRYTTAPTYDAGGNQLTPGTIQELDGVFILLSRELTDLLKANLTQEQKDELESFVYNVSATQAATWHVPVWAGGDGAVYIRVPASVWNDPTSVPPPKVRQYFQHLWREVNE